MLGGSQGSRTPLSPKSAGGGGGVVWSGPLTPPSASLNTVGEGVTLECSESPPASAKPGSGCPAARRATATRRWRPGGRACSGGTAGTPAALRGDSPGPGFDPARPRRAAPPARSFYHPEQQLPREPTSSSRHPTNDARINKINDTVVSVPFSVLGPLLI